MTEVINGATYRRHALLLGFLNKAEVDAIFAQNPIRVADGRTPAQAAQEARAGRTALGAYAVGVHAPLPTGLAAPADEVRHRPLFVNEYEAKGDFEFASVPISSLLVPQMNIDLEYVRELSENVALAPDDARDFAFAFPRSDIAEPIVKGNTVVFTAAAPNISIKPIPTVRRTADGFDIVVEAKARPNYVMIARLGGRMILQNGVHKVLALRAKGRLHTFAVVHEVQRLEELGLPHANLSMFTEPNYLAAPRPPLVEDLASPASVEVLTRATSNVYRVVIQAEEIVAPALSLREVPRGGG